MQFDREIRGTSRQLEHELWDRMGLKGTQMSKEGKVVGYYYLGRGGIGPAAWKDPTCAHALMTQASREAIAIGPEVTFLVPGINHDALQFAFAHGLRLTNVAHFLTTTSFGHMERYLPSGPAFY